MRIEQLGLEVPLPELFLGKLPSNRFNVDSERRINNKNAHICGHVVTVSRSYDGIFVEDIVY